MLCIARTMPSQDPSVRLSHAGILSKRLNISSNFIHRRIATPFWFAAPNGMAILRLRQEAPNVAPNAEKLKSHDFRPIARFISQRIQDRAIIVK